MKLKDSKCVHLRCMNCGELEHGWSAKGMLAKARAHVAETKYGCEIGDVYVQKCLHWEDSE